MNLLEMMAGPNHPKQVANAYGQLLESLKEQNTDYDQFLQDRQQGTEADISSYQRQLSPLERWRQEVDAMVQSGNPVLQQEGMKMLSQYHQRSTQPEPTPAAMSTAGKMAVEMGLTPGTKPFNDFVTQYAFKSNRMYAPKYVTPAEAKQIRWIDRENTDPLVGQNWEDIRGKVVKVDDASTMRDNAMRVIGSLEDILFNEESGIYNDDIWQGEGAAAVIRGGVAGGLQDLTQNNPKYKSYSDLRAGSAAQIVRAMGEKGALSDKDIERALALLPNISGLRGMPDLPATAEMKFKYLKLMLGIDPSQWGPILDLAEQELGTLGDTEDEWEDEGGN